MTILMVLTSHDRLRDTGKKTGLWLEEFASPTSSGDKSFAASKPVGAVCHGTAVFSRTKRPDGAPLVRGKLLTGFSNSEEAAAG